MKRDTFFSYKNGDIFQRGYYIFSENEPKIYLAWVFLVELGFSMQYIPQQGVLIGGGTSKNTDKESSPYSLIYLEKLFKS